ncbi:MAG: MFS transporter [Acidimicrobiales bacterium]
MSDPVPSGPLAAMSVRYYPRIFSSGALWSITRWMTIFLGSFLMNQLTDSPFLVQLVATCFFLPMFVGGMLAGAVSDRFDRRRTVLRQLAALVPLAVLMSVLVATDRLPTAMLYVFAAAVGLGQVVDMTTRRALINDLVGDRLFGNAIALETLSMSAGNMAGSLTGGALIQEVGAGSAYAVVAGLYLCCFLLMLSVPSSGKPTRGAPAPTADGPSGMGTVLVEMRKDLAAGVRALPANRPFVSLLGVTAAMNFLFFSFMPMIPVLARRFEVGPLLTGVLASGFGLGMLVGSLLMVVINPSRRGRIYVIGSFLGMACLVAFAFMNVFLVALVALIATGICAAGFASVQTALVMSVNPPEMRGRAMGLLSMAIGTLPFGMLLLGGIAERVGPHSAVIVVAAGGMVSLGLWLVRRPEVLQID